MSTRLWLPIAFSLFACGVDPIEVDVCGNNVVEATEDCDSRPRPEHADQAVTCAAPGAANECRYTCDRAAAVAGCPAGWECGEDNLCRHASGQYSTGIGNSA